MSSSLSRRLFIGGSAALAGAVATGAVPPARADDVAGPNPALLPGFGPKAGVAKLDANENPYGPKARRPLPPWRRPVARVRITWAGRCRC